MDPKLIDRAQRRVRLRDLETLIYIEQAGSMRKAAEELHISQPAVSKAMRELEDTLGLQLLERGRRGVAATPFGSALARRSKRLIDELQTAMRELAWMADTEASEVRIGAMETLQAGLLAAATRQQQLQHPRMRFFFESGQANELIHHFLPQRLVDVVVARPLSLPLPPGIESEPLFHDQLHVVVGPEHPFARRRKIALSELHGAQWLLSRNEAMPQTPIPMAFESLGLPMPARIVVTGSLSMRQSLLARGDFVSCVPHSMLPFVRIKGLFQVLPIELPRWPTATMILKLRGRSLSPAIETFLRTIRKLAAPLDIGGPGANRT